MAFFPKDSAIQVTPSLEEQISNAASSQEIQALLHQAAQDQKLIEPDPLDRDGKDFYSMRIVERPTAHQQDPLTKTFVINSQEFTVTGNSPAELQAAELAKMRELFATDSTARTEPSRDERGRYAQQKQNDDADNQEALRIGAHLELERKLRSGEISVADYVQQSGAVSSYLQDRGIDESALVEISKTTFTDKWRAGATAFRTRHPEWQGGNDNQAVIQNIIVEQGWENQDPATAIEAAYRLATEKGLLSDTPETKLAKGISEITDKYELQRFLQPNR